MILEPLGDNLVVRLLPSPTQHHAGNMMDEIRQKHGAIEVVHLDAHPQTWAIVEAIGPEVREVKVGHRVLISRLQGMAVGDDRLVIAEGGVLAFLEDDE